MGAHGALRCRVRTARVLVGRDAAHGRRSGRLQQDRPARGGGRAARHSCAPRRPLHTRLGTALPGQAGLAAGAAVRLRRFHGQARAALRARWELHALPIRDWQIWNEPNFDFYWYTPEQGGWAPEYAELLRQAKLAIRAQDPGATIVLAGLADASWRVLSRAYSGGIRGAFDVASINIFTGRPGFVMAAVRLNRRVLKAHHEPRKPIWVTETTFPAAKGQVPPPDQGWQRRWYTTQRGMARRLTELYTLGVRNARRLRLRRIYWYTWASTYSGFSDLFDYSGLIRVWPDGRTQPQPALRAFRRSARG